MEHELKTWPVYFRRVKSGDKTFEVRKCDRDFQIGDFLKLKEFNPDNGGYTGNEVCVYVKYILHGGDFGIQDGYCVMAIEIDQ